MTVTEDLVPGDDQLVIVVNTFCYLDDIADKGRGVDESN